MRQEEQRAEKWKTSFRQPIILFPLCDARNRLMIKKPNFKWKKNCANSVPTCQNRNLYRPNLSNILHKQQQL